MTAASEIHPKTVRGVTRIARNAKAASSLLATASTAEKNAALDAIAEALRTGTDRIVKANDADIAAGTDSGMSEALLERPGLDAVGVAAVGVSVQAVADLADAVGKVVVGRTLPNGIRLSQTRVPMGVIGASYVARRSVTVDIAVLALKPGNVPVLRGGSA